MRARLQAVTDWLNLTRRSRYDPASLAAACRVTPRTLELYTYDGIGQLKVADSSVSSENRGYAFDHCWNMNWCTNNGTANNYLVDTKNEVTNAYGATYSYDSNGNLTTGTNGSNAYVYDDENRLIQWFWYNNGTNCTGGGYRTDFFYDGLGRLRKRLEYSIPPTPGGAGAPPPSMQCVWNLNTEVYYIYDGMRVIQERDGSNNPLVAYTRGTDLSGTLEGAGGIGGLLARSDGYSGGNFTNHSYYHADGNGNITYLENSSQGLAATYRYDAYGNTVSTGGPLANGNVYRFSSKECHTNSGMYYYLYRFYDPNLQRWLNRDPVGEPRLGAVQHVHRRPQTAGAPTRTMTKLFAGGHDENRYLFVRNDPIAAVDLLGLLTFQGCDPSQEEALQESFDDMCQKLNDPHFCGCLGSSVTAQNIIRSLKNRCNNPDDPLHPITVQCEQSGTGFCNGACAWSIPGGDTIHICPDQWGNSGCGNPGCTEMHELTHMAGYPGETWPDNVEKCLGCN